MFDHSEGNYSSFGKFVDELMRDAKITKPTAKRGNY